MNRLLLTTLLLYVKVCAGQATQYTVVNKRTHEPIPYATVKVMNKPLGLFCTEAGVFTLDLETSDTVVISSAGFATRKIPGSLLSQMIELEEKTRMLVPVTVGATGALPIIRIGSGATSFGMKLPEKEEFDWGPSAVREEYAEKLEIPDTTLDYKLSALYIPVRKHDCWGPVFIRVFEASGTKDSIFNIPGEEIYSSYVSVSSASVKKQRLKIDLDSAGIFFHRQNCFFISVTWPYKSNCLTALQRIKDPAAVFYSRSLNNRSYNWIVYSAIGFGTHYCAELKVLR